MQIAPGVFASSIHTVDWEPDAEVGGDVHVLCTGVGVEAGISRITEPPASPLSYQAKGRETLLILEGGAKIEIEGGPTLNLKVGDMASIPAGSKTTWHFTTPFKEYWVIA